MAKTIEQAIAKERRSDVTVIGGGLAGLAAAIELARAGLEVTCLEPNWNFRETVGESLDWSAPDLFKSLELPMEQLIETGVCTYKRHVAFQLKDGSVTEYIPSSWLGRSPFNIELRTIHVDRERLHENLLRITAKYGVKIVHDRALSVERYGKTITAVRTALGERFVSSWVLDASGAASSFLAREFSLVSVDYGPKKVAMWAYLSTPDWQEGTTLYAEGLAKSYMDWIWEIPIHPGKTSIGYVSTGLSIKEQRSQGFPVHTIFTRQLTKFPRFQSVLRDAAFQMPNVTSFVCRVYKGVCGPNWVILGEAASQSDPITGNGVTAALRHASEASRLILKFRNKKTIPRLARMSYSLRVVEMGKFFNSLIEKLAYDWPVRDRLGLLTAGNVYTIPAWSVNHLYSRIDPQGMVSTALFSLILVFLRGLAWITHKLCRCLPVPSEAQANTSF